MAEGALVELAGNVLKLLGSLILEEVKLAISVKTEIKRLAETVSLIQPLIRVVEKQSSHSHQNEDWLRKLKVVLNDAEKLLDDFSTEVDAEETVKSVPHNPTRKNNLFRLLITELHSSLRTFGFSRENIGSKLESDGIFNHFSFHAELKIQTFCITFKPCNCATCPRIASGLSESAENNIFRTN
nr:hypothetical protein CFP56_40777 [Quercus suber]